MSLMSSQSGLPLAMVFSADEGERKSLAESLIGISMKYRRQVNFATVDAEKQSFFLEHFGLYADHLPAFVIQTDDDIFIFKQGSKITADAIDEFIRQTLRSIMGYNTQPNTFECSITSGTEDIRGIIMPKGEQVLGEGASSHLQQ